VAYREARGNRLGDYLGVKPTVLVTQDRAIRLEAAIVGVAAVAASIIKKVLIVLRRKSNFKEKHFLKEFDNNF